MQIADDRDWRLLLSVIYEYSVLGCYSVHHPVRQREGRCWCNIITFARLGG